MDIDEAIRTRHAVRSYTDAPLPSETIAALLGEIEAANAQSGLHLQLAVDEPEAFDGLISHYGHFSGVRNYLCCVGKKTRNLETRIGYYGERVVLAATMLGLDSCWVALTYSKGKAGCTIARGEKLVCVIALGYGETHGVAHQTKDPAARYRTFDGAPAPTWFMNGIDAAMLAPTAVNQQRFAFWLEPDNIVRAEATGGVNSKVDLGIVQYHFEIGAGSEHFTWNRKSRIGGSA